MSSSVYANVVAAIPYGDGTKSRFVKVGVMLQMDRNDDSKGPGFVIMIDRWFNPAGVPLRQQGDGSVALSTYWESREPGPTKSEIKKAVGDPFSET